MIGKLRQLTKDLESDSSGTFVVSDALYKLLQKEYKEIEDLRKKVE